MFIHWIADFVLQTDKQAKGKSTSISALLEHTALYSFVWVLPILFMVNGVTADITNYNFLWFAPITFVCHTIQDYITSKINKRLWEKGDSHNFFVSVGFDQFLHFSQLLLTFKLLTG